MSVGLLRDEKWIHIVDHVNELLPSMVLYFIRVEDKWQCRFTEYWAGDNV